MRVLITWGSKLGGTEGIARMLGEALPRDGIIAVVRPAREIRRLDGFDAVIVGGGLYANRWHRDARRFVARHTGALRRVPVWMFSSGPLDDSADRATIPPVRQVQALMDSVGALGHVTFGGRLAADARGFPARAMAKKLAGDWRDPARIAAWAAELADLLPAARPGVAVIPPAHGWGRVLGHAATGWAACVAMVAVLFSVTTAGVAIVFHAIVVPIVFARVAWIYFEPPGTRPPLVVALAFAGVPALLDAVLLGALAPARLGGVAATWLPIASIVAVTWAIGGLRSTQPWSRPGPAAQGSLATHGPGTGS